MPSLSPMNPPSFTLSELAEKAEQIRQRVDEINQIIRDSHLIVDIEEICISQITTAGREHIKTFRVIIKTEL